MFPNRFVADSLTGAPLPRPSTHRHKGRRPDVTHLAAVRTEQLCFPLPSLFILPSTSSDTGQGRGALPGSGLQVLGVEGRWMGRRAAFIDTPACAGSQRHPRPSQHKHTASLLCRGLSLKWPGGFDGTSCLLQKQGVFVHRYIRYPFSEGMAPLGQIRAGYPRTGQASAGEGLQG